jgi:hypothetical protein
MEKQLLTTGDVIDALGGTEKVAEITRRKYTAVWNWKKAEAFPPNTFLILQDALKSKGLEAPLSLWRMEQPAEAGAQ